MANTNNLSFCVCVCEREGGRDIKVKRGKGNCKRERWSLRVATVTQHRGCQDVLIPATRHWQQAMLEIPIACQELLGNTARLVLWKMDVSSKHTRQHRKPDSARSGTRSFSFPTSLEPRPTASVSWLLRGPWALVYTNGSGPLSLRMRKVPECAQLTARGDEDTQTVLAGWRASV